MINAHTNVILIALVKPFDCPNCPKQFKHKKTLERHITKKHQGKRKNDKVLKTTDDIKKEKLESEDEEMDTTDESTADDDESQANVDQLNANEEFMQFYENNGYIHETYNNEENQQNPIINIPNEVFNNEEVMQANDLAGDMNMANFVNVKLEVIGE